MQGILFKRALRDLKANAVRNAMLFCLIAVSMFLVTGIIGSGLSVMRTVDGKAAANQLEDGEFGTLVPLAETEITGIEALGVTIEPCFYLEFEMDDGTVLRVMKNREAINLLEPTEGRVASAAGEIAVERLYAAAHGLSAGGDLLIAGRSFQVTGTVTTPDYDTCKRNLTDMASDDWGFGTAFVTEGDYERLRVGGGAQFGETYRYAYRLGPGAGEGALKDHLLALEISPEEVEDIYFQEAVRREAEDRDSLEGGVSDLSDGSREIDEAAAKLSGGAQELLDGVQGVKDGLAALDGKSADLAAGSSAVLAALREIESGAGALSFSASSARDLSGAAAALADAQAALSGSLGALSGGVGYEVLEPAVRDALAQAGMDPDALSPDAQVALGVTQAYLDEVDKGLAEAAAAAAALEGQLAAFNESMAALPGAVDALNGGIGKLQGAIAALRASDESLDAGVSSYTRGVGSIRENYERIAAGAQDMNEGARLLADSSGALRDGAAELKEETDAMLEAHFPLEIEALTDFLPAGDNPRIKASKDDVAINVNAGFVAGVMILILIAYVISVFVVHSIDRESAMLGALYALGLRRRQLALHYTMAPVLLCAAGGVAGTLLGHTGFALSFLAGDTYSYFSIPEIEIAYHPAVLAYGVALPPAAAFLVNLLVIRKKLGRSALSLLRKERFQGAGGGARLKNMPFVRAFQVRQFLREKRSCFAVLAGMFISLLVLTLGLDCYALVVNIAEQTEADTKYAFSYQYKYPSEAAPEGGTPAYVENLKKGIYSYDMDVSVIGLPEGNPYFPAITSRKENEISVSSSMAEKFGLSPGDKVVLSDEVNDRDYGFTVREVVPYSVGLVCFMELGSMRSLFGRDEGFYNTVYASRALDIPAGRLYATTTRADVLKSADIFMDVLRSMIATMVGCAALMFLIVLYQMTKVMVDRAAGGISLMKVFGYRGREIRKLYLDGNFLLIALGALAMIPAAKMAMDAVFPMLVANVPTGLDLRWPPLLYAAVYAGMLLCYLLIRTALAGKLNRLSPSAVLKDTE
ncbi:MAG: hypothetical protein LBR44_05115 [Clostridiales Family XIII bacterium]|jgi:putative ABC transport system permease protein|nr:hypothetical protein [Clostridiales Family XIII bacterium]